MSLILTAGLKIRPRVQVRAWAFFPGIGYFWSTNFPRNMGKQDGISAKRRRICKKIWSLTNFAKLIRKILVYSSRSVRSTRMAEDVRMGGKRPWSSHHIGLRGRNQKRLYNTRYVVPFAVGRNLVLFVGVMLRGVPTHTIQEKMHAPKKHSQRLPPKRQTSQEVLRIENV